MNPEDRVLDAIAELVDESIAHGPTDDYDRPYQERCELCGMAWHGLPRWGCPGAHATDEERQRYSSGGILLGDRWKLPEDPFDPGDWWPDEYTELPPAMQFPRVDFAPLIEGFAELRERMLAWLANELPAIQATSWVPGDE